MFNVGLESRVCPTNIGDATIYKTLGHYARILVEADLLKPIRDHILVEREDFAFHVYVDYEYLPSFFTTCSTIGHTAEECFKGQQNKDQLRRKSGNLASKKSVPRYVPKEKVKDPVVQPNKGKEILIDVSPKAKVGSSGAEADKGNDSVSTSKFLSGKVPHGIEETDQINEDTQGIDNVDLVDDSASVDTVFDESNQEHPSHVSDSSPEFEGE